ncbi:MAG: reverse transcriptase domain-containing protein, partial [Aeromonas sp.]|uniref:reverse transcriptase domain-containing protein n=1 Tax=Aeromonas sp. TaxID=647 RepID=UPI003F3E7DB5
MDTYEVILEAEYQRLKAKHNITAIPTMCIHTVKTDGAGNPVRAKSRTVVMGNAEERYWTKNDLFAPVLMKHTIRTLTGLAVSKGRRVKQCDAKNAFCHPTLPEDEICVCIPPRGCPYSAPGTYWRLKKTLYGLRRSPRHWYQTFKAVLLDIGLTMCTHEPCAFIGQSPTGGTIYFGTYVDDCMYFGTDDATELWFEQELGKRLVIDFMGDLSYYLGVFYEWGRTADGRLTVHCSQEGHIHRMLEQFNLSTAHAVRTPFRSGHIIDRNLHDGQPPESKPTLVKDYQSLVGGLNWISLSTRPDITGSVCLLATYLHNPSQGHLDSAKHVLKYLKGTMDWGIRFTQPPAEPSYDSFDPADCLNAIVAWPTDDQPRVATVDRLDTYTDSNWGPQDASRPKPDETRTDAEMYSLLGSVITYMGVPLTAAVSVRSPPAAVCA